MPFAPNGHRVEIVRYDALPDRPRTEYAATCVDCLWMGLSRGSRVRAEEDVVRHKPDRAELPLPDEASSTTGK
jgi:hypothetical protein